MNCPFCASLRTVANVADLRRRLAFISPLPLTGQDRITWNIFVSWAGQIVFIAFGFILPRLISDSLGQVSLGIWDFAWSIVSYMSLAMLGVGSSVNRYVASYRAAGNSVKLNAIMSSVLVIQLIIATVVVFATYGVHTAIPIWFSDRLGNQVSDAQYVSVLLGIGLAIQISLDSYRGLITGCHRWDLHNILNSVQYLCSASLITSKTASRRCRSYGNRRMPSRQRAFTVTSENGRVGKESLEHGGTSGLEMRHHGHPNHVVKNRLLRRGLNHFQLPRHVTGLAT